MSPLQYSLHALQRMAQRGLREAIVEFVVAHGRTTPTHNGAILCRIDSRSQVQLATLGLIVPSQAAGVHVIVDPAIAIVVTVYRNRAGVPLRSNLRRHHHRRSLRRWREP